MFALPNLCKLTICYCNHIIIHATATTTDATTPATSNISTTTSSTLLPLLLLLLLLYFNCFPYLQQDFIKYDEEEEDQDDSDEYVVMINCWLQIKQSE